MSATFWKAWPNVGPAEEFATRDEAEDHVRRYGGAIRKCREVGRSGRAYDLIGDTIEVSPAVRSVPLSEGHASQERS